MRFRLSPPIKHCNCAANPNHREDGSALAAPSQETPRCSALSRDGPAAARTSILLWRRVTARRGRAFVFSDEHAAAQCRRSAPPNPAELVALNSVRRRDPLSLHWALHPHSRGLVAMLSPQHGLVTRLAQSSFHPLIGPASAADADDLFHGSIYCNGCRDEVFLHVPRKAGSGGIDERLAEPI